VGRGSGAGGLAMAWGRPKPPSRIKNLKQREGQNIGRMEGFDTPFWGRGVYLSLRGGLVPFDQPS